MPGYEIIGKEEKDAVDEVFNNGGVLFRHGFEKMRKGMYKVDDFEKEFAKKIGVNYCRAVSSGTAALKVALKALGVKPGDEVITQCFTFVATVEAIIDVGAVPVITEVNETLNMDPADLRSKITEKTRVIIPVHMLGGPCQMDEIASIAKEKNIFVLEDTAQALGAEYKGKKTGTIGDIGIFSFDFGKTLTTGEGGMVATNNKELFLKAKEYSDHGHQENPNFPRGEDTRRIPGFNYSMTELQGAVGLAQLKKFDFIMERQKENQKKLKENLAENIPQIILRKNADDKGDAGDTLVFFAESPEKAEKIAKSLADNGFGTKNIPSALKWHFAGTWDHMLAKYERYKNKNLMEIWNKSYSILSKAVAIPILINMDDSQINNIVKIISEDI